MAVNEKKSRVRIGAGQRGSNSDEQGAVTANDEWVTSTMKQVSNFIPNHPGEAQEVSEADDTRGCVADRIGDSACRLPASSISSACTTPAARRAAGIS